MMLVSVQDTSKPGGAEFQQAARHTVRLPTDQLVGALNEHVSL